MIELCLCYSSLWLLHDECIHLLSLCILCGSPALWNHIEFMGTESIMYSNPLKISNRTVEMIPMLWWWKDWSPDSIHVIGIVIQHALLSYDTDYVLIAGTVIQHILLYLRLSIMFSYGVQIYVIPCFWYSIACMLACLLYCCFIWLLWCSMLYSLFVAWMLWVSLFLASLITMYVSYFLLDIL